MHTAMRLVRLTENPLEPTSHLGGHGRGVGQVLGQVDNFHVVMEAPKEVIEAFGIFDSAEELGVEPDDDALPPKAYERGRWN